MLTYVSLKDEVEKFSEVFFRNVPNPFMSKIPKQLDTFSRSYSN